MTNEQSTGAAILHFGNPGPHPQTSQRTWVSNRPFDEVLNGLRQAIDAAGMKVLHEIDAQKALSGFGHAVDGARLVLFFHPELLARLLRTDWTSIADAPLKLAMIQLPDGTVSVRMADLAATFARYDNPALAAFGQELAQTCERIIGGSV